MSTLNDKKDYLQCGYWWRRETAMQIFPSTVVSLTAKMNRQKNTLFGIVNTTAIRALPNTYNAPEIHCFGDCRRPCWHYPAPQNWLRTSQLNCVCRKQIKNRL